MGKDQEAYWNQAAKEKEFTTPFQIGLFSRYVDRDAKILDIGCGYGRILEELYRKGFNSLYGVDFSEKMIEKGRQRFPCLNLKKAAMPYGFENHQFDAVLLVAVLTCIVSNRDQALLMEEILRLLKPGGVLYINDFLINSDARNQLRYAQYAEKYGVYGTFELPEGAVLRHHDKEYVQRLTRGFEQVAFSEKTYVTMNQNRSSGFYYLGRKK